MLGITSRLRQHRALFAVCLGLTAGLGLNARGAAAAQAAIAPVGDKPKAMAIGGIDIEKDGAHRTVRIKTSAEPTFTVFRLNDPMRVIIDISGGDVSALHGPLIYEDGVLDQVALRQYEADGFVMGRVIVGFDHPCSYDVQTDGHDVILRADGTAHDIAPHLPAVAQPIADEPRTLSAESAVEAPAPTQRTQAMTAPQMTPAEAQIDTAQAQPKAQTTTAKAAEPAQAAKVPNTAQSPSAEQPQTATKTQASTGPVRLTGVRADGDSIQLELSAQPSYTTQQLDSPARLVIDIANAQNQSKSSVYRMAMPWLSRVRLGEQPQGLRVVFDLKDGQIPGIEASAQGLRIVAPAPHKTATTQAPAPQKAARSAMVATGELLDVRFNSRQTADSAKTRIELKLRGDVQAQVDTSQDRAWVLQLSGAKVAKELQRSLDTSAYPGVVSLVSTFQAEDEPPQVNVVVSLTGPATQRLRRLKNRWVWEIDGESPDAQVSAAAPKTAGFEAGAALLAAAVPQAAAGTLGKRISLDVKDADIINVLRLISEETGENIIASDEVKGKVTLKLRNVPAEQALDTMLRTKGFDKVRQNNILRIASAEAIQKERDLDLARRRSLTEVEDTLIKMVTVNYATASEIHDQIKPMLSPRGSVQVDSRTNTLILQDISSNIDRLVELSRRLDKQTPLVNIQARIVEATTSYLRDLGVQWGGSSQETARTGNATGLSFPGDIIARGGADDPKTNLVAGISTPANYAVNLPAALNAQGGGIGFILGSAGGSQLLNLRLTAMESNGNGKIISSPEISTLDNKTARVSQGVDIPISVVSAAGTNTRFQSAVLELEVTPHVTNDGTVLLKIHVQKSQPDFTNRGSDGNPTIQRKQAETEVLVKDGDTSVIGGIYTRDQGDSYSEIPFLARIPLLGNLFREHQSRDSRSELLVFITPRIINRDESVVQSGSVLEGAKN